MMCDEFLLGIWYSLSITDHLFFSETNSLDLSSSCSCCISPGDCPKKITVIFLFSVAFWIVRPSMILYFQEIIYAVLMGR